MSGKRLLDLAALFNASRGVAQKHVALRARQLDVYNRTSTLAAAVRNQTERVTETARAARVLAGRMNEGKPAWAEEDIPRDSGKATTSTEGAENAVEKERSGYNESATEELDIQQEEATQDPLPDGTIPLPESQIDPTPSSSNHTSEPLSPLKARTVQRQAENQIPAKTADAVGETIDPLVAGHDEDSFYRKSGHTSPTLSSLPRVKIPKHPSDVQEQGRILEASQINSESFYQARGADERSSAQDVPEPEPAPEGINTEIFRSPRVAKSLASNSQRKQHNELEMRAGKGTPVDQTKVSQGRDQDSFNVRETSQTEPTPPSLDLKSPSNESESFEKLAEEISEQASKVNIFVYINMWWCGALLITNSDAVQRIPNIRASSLPVT